MLLPVVQDPGPGLVPVVQGPGPGLAHAATLAAQPTTTPPPFCQTIELNRADVLLTAGRMRGSALSRVCDG